MVEKGCSVPNTDGAANVSDDELPVVVHDAVTLPTCVAPRHPVLLNNIRG